MSTCASRPIAPASTEAGDRNQGIEGGFAVGGLTNQVKGVVSQNLLFLAPDSPAST